ncbi:MAG: gliding motility-associated C-terminal domain-containing protein [Bacteroidota bacterium]
MRWRLIQILALLLLSAGSRATHIVGGELGYQFIEKITDEFGVTVYVYVVTARINKDVNATGTLPDAVVLNVHNTITNYFLTQKSLYKISQYAMPISTTLPCTVVPPGAAYEVGIYSDTIALAFSPDGYTLGTSSCCRLTGLANTVNSINTGATYTASIPPHNVIEINSTPVTNDSIKIICKDVPAYFTVPFYDPDDDTLRYEFCGAYDVDGDPPFTSVKYSPGYSGANPLNGNPQITIDPITGQIKGLVQTPGDYVVCFCVQEIRGGKVINVYRKEFQYRVTECATVSSLPDKYYSCKSLAITFLNDNNPTYNYRWDFGVSSLTNDTSSARVPSFTYPDTGSYRIRLIVGRNELCTDTSYSTVIAYPVFNAAFTFPQLRCSSNPILFNDASTATYGFGTKWKWYTQYPSSQPFRLVDTVQNPNLHFGTQTGNDTIARVKLWVESSKGCIDSIVQTMPIAQSPQLNAGPDLNFCLGDNTMINASSNSSRVEWRPSSFLSNAFVIKPNASPPATTTYQLLAQNDLCTSRDTVIINVTPKPFPNAGADTVLCFGDGAQLNGQGGQSFSWSPGTGLSNPLIRNPMARPPVSTTYILSVIDTLGCNRIFKDSVFIRVVPKMKINAGKDTFVVVPNSVQLTATGAPMYRWGPASFLDDANKTSPVATISSTQTFYVRGYTSEGCEGFDTMKVRVLEHEPDIYVPSAFSPNNDGLNDILKPVGYGVEYIEIFAVYNRLGQQLFVTTTFGKGWDGMYNGKRQPEGTYVWQLKARDFRNKVIEKKGTTVLVR